jgi:uncharacterized repeat protein (TIGR01451 family)
VQQAGTHLTARSPQFAGTVVAADQTAVTPGGVVQFDATVTSTNAGACSPAIFTGVITIDPVTNLLNGSVSGVNANCAVETDTFTLRNGSTLTAAGVNTNGLTFDNVVVTFDSGAVEQFDNVTFQSYLPEVPQLRIHHPGVPGGLTFNGLRFDVTPTTGFYIVATDTAPVDPNLLTIDLRNATANDGPAHTQVAGGAVVNWIGQTADLSVSQLRAPNVVFVGNNVTYTVTVTNTGPNAANGVTLTDTLPAGAPLISATPSQGSCAVAPGVVTCNVGALASGGSSATVAIAVAANTVGTLQNTAAVSSATADPVAANNVSTDTTTVQSALAADVSISKSHVPLQPVVGQNLTYVVTVTNNGPATATQVVMTDTLPASVTFVSVSDPNCSRIGVTVTCPVNSLANGASATFSITVTPTVAEPVTNNATVSAAQADPVGANNAASDPAMILAFGSCSAPTFSGPYPFGVGPQGATTVATADFNSDGRIDVAVSQGNGNQIALLLGQGDGTFGPPTYITVGNNPSNVIAGDFNHDGRPDLAVANPSQSVSVLLNNGVGGFSSAVDYAVSGRPFIGPAVDLDGDGNLDLVVADLAPSATNIAVLFGNADGTFASAVALQSGPSPTFVVLGDFDHNGTIDIAVPNTGTNHISILKNNGNRSFSAPVFITLPQNVFRLRQLDDVNGDGLPDLGVTTNGGSGPTNLLLLLNTGAATFAAPVELLPSSYAVGHAASGDFNADGKPDLAVVSNQGGGLASLLVMLGHGDGNYDAPIPYLVGFPLDHQVVDLNGDGKPDVIGPSGRSNDIWVLLNECGAGSVADLTVAKSGPATANAGDTVTYTVTVTNHGPAVATGVVITDAPSTSGMTILGASSASASCSTTVARATCTVPTLTVGAAATVTVSVQATAAGTRVNRATATSRDSDPNPADNSSSATTTVSAGSITFTVTNTQDSGTGSLRQAILESNANPGATNRINFNIPGSGPFTIAPTTALSAITVPVVIDATTQPGFSGAPIVELTGSNTISNGLNITAGSSTVRGLVINRFTANGISIGTNGNNVIEGNFIGTDISGTVARGNTNNGVEIQTSGNWIGGPSAQQRNVISGNGTATIAGNGIGVFGNGSDNHVEGNYIGTDLTGTAIVANTGHGVSIGGTSSTTTVGGTVPGAGNVISGNGTAALPAAGVNIFQGGGSNVILGNSIGTNASGSAALPNSIGGIVIDGSSNNTIGGTTTAARNLISGNGSFGNVISGVQFFNASSNNAVVGNYIGTDATGTSSVANSGSGIFITGNGGGNVVGGLVAGAGNVISGNGGGSGVTLFQHAGGGVLVAGNRIGTDPTGTFAIPNVGNGVNIEGSSNNTVGGVTSLARNVISGNGGNGVQVRAGSSSNVILGNYIGVDGAGAAALGNADTASKCWVTLRRTTPLAVWWLVAGTGSDSTVAWAWMLRREPAPWDRQPDSRERDLLERWLRNRSRRRWRHEQRSRGRRHRRKQPAEFPGARVRDARHGSHRRAEQHTEHHVPPRHLRERHV